MRFEPCAVDGAFIVDIEPREDERGFFARIFDAEEFARMGLEPGTAQANLSYNRLRGTLRGMHLQDETAVETKLVRCIRGAIHDIIVDMRPASPTYLAHCAVDLSAENRRALFVPGLVAHGFQTLEDDSEVTYQVGAPYTPGAEQGYRHDDPALGLEWPLPVTEISAKDRAWPLLDARGGQGA